MSLRGLAGIDQYRDGRSFCDGFRVLQWVVHRWCVIHTDPDGYCCVRYLYWNGDRWNWNYNWLDNLWNAADPAAVLATRFISLPVSRRECFVL